MSTLDRHRPDAARRCPTAARTPAVPAGPALAGAGQAQPHQDLAYARGAHRRHPAAGAVPGHLRVHLRRRGRRLDPRLPAVPAARHPGADHRDRRASRSASTSTPTSPRASSTGSGRCRSPARRRWSARSSATSCGTSSSRSSTLGDRLPDGLPDRRPTRCGAIAGCLLAVLFALCLSWLPVCVGMKVRTAGRRAGHDVRADHAAELRVQRVRRRRHAAGLDAGVRRRSTR